MALCGSCPILARVCGFNNVIRSVNKSSGVFLKLSPRLAAASHFYTTGSNAEEKKEEGDAKRANVSKAMRAYLERSKAHDEFMKQQNTEFQIGKRHLANMMGEDPETFTQDDINKAIEYLLPSGLFDPRARPMMRPPEEVFPQRKAAEFDISGRPHHSMFYTSKPNFYQLLHDIVSHLHQLNKFEDKMIRNGANPDPKDSVDMSGTVWLAKDDLEKTLVELINDKDYEMFLQAIKRLAEHPYSVQSKDFLKMYQKPLMSQTKTFDIPKPEFDADGRAFITTKDCMRKNARGVVTLRGNGSGKIAINERDISYFKDVQQREQTVVIETIAEAESNLQKLEQKCGDEGNVRTQ